MELEVTIPGLDLALETQIEYDVGTMIELLGPNRELAHPEPRFLHLVVQEMELTNDNSVDWYFDENVLVVYGRVWLTHNDGEPVDIKWGSGPYALYRFNIARLERRDLSVWTS